jgi:apolipoprotein N-acyltransferase
VSAAGAPRILAALVAGAATVFGFAPFGIAYVPVVALAFLVALWQGAASARAAAAMGFAFGLGLFVAGASWVFIALNTFGGMPLLLAGIGTAGFCAFLALYPALTGWLAVRWTKTRSWERALAAAAIWTLSEWARSIVFTGFPWLSIGYASLPGGAASLLAGYAPVGGVFLVTLATALAAAALAIAIDAFAIGARGRIATAAALAAVVALGGAALGRIEWTSPAGAPVAISLVQGNVTQDLKFSPDFRRTTFELYTGLVRASRGRLVVLPESAFPVFADEVPERGRDLLDAVAARDVSPACSPFLLRSFRRPHLHSSVVSIGATSRGSTASATSSLRRDDSARAVVNSSQDIVDSDRSQASGVPDPPVLQVAGRRGRQHLLRRCVRRGDPRAGRGGDHARQRHQRRLVRPLARRVPAQPDRGDARARDRAAAAPRDEHGNHLRHRSRRARTRAAAVVHSRHSRSRDHGA